MSKALDHALASLVDPRQRSDEPLMNWVPDGCFRCGAETERGSSTCGPCGAWLRCETDEDPRGDDEGALWDRRLLAAHQATLVEPPGRLVLHDDWFRRLWCAAGRTFTVAHTFTTEGDAG
jgi:hypothetical protein